MGKRRLKQCKACRRKFTPKNQPILEVQAEEEAPIKNPEEKVDDNGAQDDSVSNEATKSNKATTEPADDSKPLLNALDKEWTS